jgi:hypothetical protein
MERTRIRQCIRLKSRNGWAYALWAIIALALGLSSFVVITATKAYGQPVTSAEGAPERRVWPPVIEKCDLPMWDRVRSMCGNEHD